MGHIVNPLSIRLGHSTTWQDFWQVKSNFYPEVLHNVLELKRYVSHFFRGVFFERGGFLFSHSNILLSYNSYNVYIYGYDGKTEEWIELLLAKLRKNFGKVHLKSRKFLAKKRRLNFKVHSWLTVERYKHEYLLVRKMLLFIVLGLEWSKFFNKKRKFKNFYSKIKVWFRCYLYFTRVFIYYDRLASSFFFNFLSKFRFLKNFFKSKRKLRFNSLNTFRKTRKNYSKRKKLSFKSNNRVIENFFKGLKRKNNKNIMHIYTFQVLFFVFHIINKLFKLRSSLTNKKTLSSHFRSTLSYNRLFIYWVFDKIFYKVMRFYWLLFHQSSFFQAFNEYLSWVTRKLTYLPSKFFFFGLTNNTVTATMLSWYLIRKLEQRFSLFEIFKPVSRELKLLIKRYNVLHGFKLQFKGRLTRRDRSRRIWMSGGRVPLQSAGALIDYSYTRSQLKNGSCGVKVFLYRVSNFKKCTYRIV